MWLAKAWTAIDRLSVIWKSDLINRMKHNFFQAAVVSILLYGCTTWMLTKCVKKKLDGNYTRMLQRLYGHLTPITKTIEVRWTRHAGHCWRSRDELINDIIPSHERAKSGRPVRTYIQQVYANTGYRLTGSDGWWRWVAREDQGDLCWLCNMMRMMITYYIYIYIYIYISYLILYGETFKEL